MDSYIKTFNVTEKRPKVLLLGNGLTYNSETNWQNIIHELSRSEAPSLECPKIPYSVQASIETSIVDTIRHQKYEKYFKNNYVYRDYPLLKQIVMLDFDAILTTNYTYEIERCFYEGYEKFSDYKLRKIASSTVAKESKYMIHTYNHVQKDSITRDIWHIHGEVRRKSSMILTHDEYTHLIGKLVEYNQYVGSAYVNEKENISFRSWFDYFVLGDVYIVGQEVNFSEFDLWWLLSRRVKEKDNIGMGKIYYFNPLSATGERTPIEIALKALGAEIEDCGIQLTGDKAKDDMLYSQFYERAITKLSKCIK